MAFPDQTLHFVARLQKSEKAEIMGYDSVFPASGLRDALLSAVEEVCLDRLQRAEGCLRTARQLLELSEPESLRTAAGRAYYSIHHSLRAMALWKNKWDPDGHEASIKQFLFLLDDKTFVNQCRFANFPNGRDPVECVSEARINRHVADYSPYDSQRELIGNVVGITGNDWNRAATFNIEVAQVLVDSAYRVLGS